MAAYSRSEFCDEVLNSSYPVENNYNIIPSGNLGSDTRSVNNVNDVDHAAPCNNYRVEDVRQRSYVWRKPKIFDSLSETLFTNPWVVWACFEWRVDPRMIYKMGQHIAVWEIEGQIKEIRFSTDAGNKGKCLYGKLNKIKERIAK